MRKEKDVEREEGHPSPIKDFFKRKNPAEFFAAFMAVSLIIYLIASLIWGGKVLCGIFFAALLFRIFYCLRTFTSTKFV